MNLQTVATKALAAHQRQKLRLQALESLGVPSMEELLKIEDKD